MDKNTKQKLKRIWCERSVIGLLGLTALGFFVAKTPTVYEQVQAQVQFNQAQTQYYQAQTQAWAQFDQALAPAQAWAQFDQALVQYDQALARASAQYHQAWARASAQYHQAPTQAQFNQALTQAQDDLTQQVLVSGLTTLQYQFMFLGISALCFILMLLLLLTRNQISLPLTAQLITFLPEECIVELEALHQQIKSEEDSIWVIRMNMLCYVLVSLWAFHVQINVDNLSLPKNKGHKKIDD